MKSIKIIFLLAITVLASSCSNLKLEEIEPGTNSSSSICAHSKTSLDKKLKIEKGIRGKVLFQGEHEVLKSIQDKMSEYKVPALSLAVIENGRIAWAETYQNANFPELKKLGCNSAFQTASLSKPVTFLAALRMQSAKQIDLNKDIQSYLSGFKLPSGKQTSESPVTLRNIFSHTSGITPGGYRGYKKGTPVPTDIEVLRGSEGVNSNAVEVLTVPNQSLAYSGGGYTLAEVALQDYFNDSFENIMKDWILEPANMSNSTFSQFASDSEFSHAVEGYQQSGNVIEGGWRIHPEQAAAGLWSNPTDMAKLLIEVYKAYQGKNSLFSQSEIHSMLNKERDGHVYGFIFDDSNDGKSITHYGGNAGYRSGMTIDLETGNGLVYLTNSDNGGALGNELLLSASRIYGWNHFKQIKVKRKKINNLVLRQLSGQFKWNDRIDLSIRYEENQKFIYLIFPNGDEYKLTPIEGEELEFIHQKTGVKVSFLNNDKNNSFILYGGKAVKIEPTK